MQERERDRTGASTPGTMATRVTRAILEANAVVALRSPAWWRSLPRKIAVVLVVVLIALAGVTWRLGGVTATAAYLLGKETRLNFPAGEGIRRLAVRVLATRELPPDVVAQLARLAHVLPSDDPLRPSVLAALGRATGVEVHEAGPDTLLRIDDAVARLTGRPLSARGILEWRPLDPYFVITLDELAGVSGVARAVEVFNGLQPPDGLPTSEWYLDELVNGFDDPRPLPFVLVASTNGDDWGPLAMATDAVPSYARRLPADTVGEALRVGLWGFDAYHPGDPGTDAAAWWQHVAREHALPTFASPAPPAPMP